MVKRRQRNISKRIKTRHKKAKVNRKEGKQHVDPRSSHLNKMITASMTMSTKTANQPFSLATHSNVPKIEASSISFEELMKLRGEGNEDKPKKGKLSLIDLNYLEPLLRKWGDNYSEMANDVRMNRMQWTEKQIQKKYLAYYAMGLTNNVHNE